MEKNLAYVANSLIRKYKRFMESIDNLYDSPYSGIDEKREILEEFYPHIKMGKNGIKTANASDNQVNAAYNNSKESIKERLNKYVNELSPLTLNSDNYEVRDEFIFKKLIERYLHMNKQKIIEISMKIKEDEVIYSFDRISYKVDSNENRGMVVNDFKRFIMRMDVNYILDERKKIWYRGEKVHPPTIEKRNDTYYIPIFVDE